jgi:hypothetical protein
MKLSHAKKKKVQEENMQQHIRNAMRHANFVTERQLACLSDDDLLKLPNFDKSTLKWLRNAYPTAR